MAGRYPWLEQNQSKEQKRLAKEIKDLQKRLYVVGGAPPGMAMDTGYGENGALDPSMPTHLMQTNAGPRTIHEGERLLPRPNGSFNVIPASQMGGQGALSALEQQHNIPGYQEGTLTRTAQANPVLGSMPKPLTMNLAPKPEPSQESLLLTHSGGNMQPKPEPSQESLLLTHSGGNMQPKPEPLRVPPTEAPPTIEGTVAKAKPTTIRDIIPDPNMNQEPPSPPKPDATPDDIARKVGLGALALYAAGDTPQDRKVREQERSRLANEAAAARSALEQNLAQAGMSGQEAMTERALLDAQLNAKENEVMAQLRAQQAERTFTAINELARQGLAGQQLAEGARQFDESMSLSRDQLAEGARQFNENMSFVKDKYGDEKGTRMAADAASGMSFDTWKNLHPEGSKEDWDNMRQGWSLGVEAMELQNLSETIGIEAGRIQNVANLIDQYGYTLNQVNNLDLDGDGVPDFNFTRDQYNSISALRNVRVTAGQLANTAAELGIDITKASTAADLFARGMSPEDVNERLGTNFSDTDRDDILAASTYGMWKSEFDWKKQQAEMEHGYNLLSLGTPESIASAAEIFNKNLPGANINFRTLITEANVEGFNQGMQQISQLIASNVDWRAMLKNDMDGAKDIAKLMGMPTGSTDWAQTANKLGAIYEAMDANYIDLQWQTIEESRWFQRQPANVRKDITDTFDSVISGDLYVEWNDTGKYEAYNDTGAYIGTFDTQAQAKTAAGEFGKVEAERTLNFKDVDNSAVTVNVGGTGFGSGKTTPPEDVPVGGTYVGADGKLYRNKGAGVEPEEIPFATANLEEPWSPEAEAVIKAGPQSAYYNDVVEARAQALIAGDVPKERVAGLDVQDPLFQEVAKRARSDFDGTQTNKDGNALRFANTNVQPNSYFVMDGVLLHTAEGVNEGGVTQSPLNGEMAGHEFIDATFYNPKTKQWVPIRLVAGQNPFEQVEGYVGKSNATATAKAEPVVTTMPTPLTVDLSHLTRTT